MQEYLENPSALIGTTVEHTQREGSSSTILDAWREKSHIVVSIPCNYCGAPLTRTLYIARQKGAACPECQRTVARNSMKKIGHGNKTNEYADNLIGKELAPDKGGRPTKIIRWEFQERVVDGETIKGSRVYFSSCVECGIEVRKALSHMRERECLCRSCAATIYTSQRAEKKRNAAAAMSQERAQELVGQEIMPASGNQIPAKILSWEVIHHKIGYIVACVDCGVHMRLSLDRIQSRTVYCSECKRKAANLPRNSPDPIKKQVSNTLPFMPKHREIETKVLWKEHDEEDYQRRLDALNAKYGGKS